MLSLQVCGLVVSSLSSLPSPQWLQVTSAAYDCPVSVTRSEQRVSLSALDRRVSVTPGTWRVLPAEQAARARPGDGVRLPADPWPVIRDGTLRRALLDASARGAALLVETDRPGTLGAVATTYRGLNLTPSAAFVPDLSGNLNLWPRGTAVVARLDGAPLLPRLAQLPGRTVVPFEPDGTGGQRAAPDAPTTLRVAPRLEWSFAGQTYRSDAEPGALAGALSRVMPVMWAAGHALNGTLPSLLLNLSSAAAWVVLAVMLLSGGALLRALVRR